MDNPYGLTWVSNEPWGYAPYHYGRWANASNEWVWVPESRKYLPDVFAGAGGFHSFGQVEQRLGGAWDRAILIS